MGTLKSESCRRFVAGRLRLLPTLQLSLRFDILFSERATTEAPVLNEWVTFPESLLLVVVE